MLSPGQRWSASLSIRVQPGVRVQPRDVVECEGWDWTLEVGLGLAGGSDCNRTRRPGQARGAPQPEEMR